MGSTLARLGRRMLRRVASLSSPLERSGVHRTRDPLQKTPGERLDPALTGKVHRHRMARAGLLIGGVATKSGMTRKAIRLSEGPASCRLPVGRRPARESMGQRPWAC